MCVCVRACVRAYMHAYMCVCVCMFVCACVCMCVHTRALVCVHACMFMLYHVLYIYMCDVLIDSQARDWFFIRMMRYLRSSRSRRIPSVRTLYKHDNNAYIMCICI